MPRLLTNDIVKAAITGLEEQQTRIDAQIAQLRQMLSGGSAETAAPPPAPRRKRRKLSAAGRRAIAEAQRKRWAESKQHAEPPAPAAPEAVSYTHLDVYKRQHLFDPILASGSGTPSNNRRAGVDRKAARSVWRRRASRVGGDEVRSGQTGGRHRDHSVVLPRARKGS